MKQGPSEHENVPYGMHDRHPFEAVETMPAVYATPPANSKNQAMQRHAVHQGDCRDHTHQPLAA